MNDVLQSGQPTTLFGLVAFVVTSFTGLLVWMVRRSETRQDRLADRYFGFLEKTLDQQRTDHEQHTAALRKMTDNVKELTAGIRDIAKSQAEDMDEFRAVIPTICRDRKRGEA